MDAHLREFLFKGRMPDHGLQVADVAVHVPVGEEAQEMERPAAVPAGIDHTPPSLAGEERRPDSMAPFTSSAPWG